MNNSNVINLNICYGCMKELPQGSAICPSCKYNNSLRHNPIDALPEGTVLHGKYLVGKYLRKNLEQINYLGYDLISKSAVEIREYFPTGLTSRLKPMYDVNWEVREGINPSEKCNSFLKAVKASVPSVQESFFEHKTAYVVSGYKPSREPGLSGGSAPKGPQLNPEIKKGMVSSRSAVPQVQPVSKQKKRKRPVLFIAVLAVIAAAVMIPLMKGQKAIKAAEQAYASGNYEEASQLYKEAGNYVFWDRKADEGYRDANLQIAEKALQEEDYFHAIEIYKKLDDQEKVQQAGRDGAAAAVEKGDYRLAVDIYEAIGNTEQAKVAWNAYGITQLKAGNYEEAINAFQAGDDKENERKAHQVWGDALFQKMAYEEAINQYKLAGDNEAVRKSYSAWGDDLLKKSDYDGAIKQYKLAGEEGKAENVVLKKSEDLISSGKASEVPAVLQGFNGQKIAQTVFSALNVQTRGMNSSESDKQAAVFGSYIQEVDTQLAYCKLLQDNGYNLKSVYPDGVKVNADLAKYQLVEMLSKESTRKPDCNKVLVFSREEESPVLEGKSAKTEQEVDQIVDNVTESRKNTAFNYSVKLMPGLMDSFSKDEQAWSMQECTAVVLLEKGFYPEGSLTIRTIQTSTIGSVTYNTSVSYRAYIHYMSYEGIAVYDKENPLIGVSYNGYFNNSPMSNCVVGNDYADAGIDLSGVEIEEIQKALENESSEESQKILSKYDKKVVDLVRKTGWGDYILIPDTDENGKTQNFKGSTSNADAWNIAKYMCGKFEDGWMQTQLKAGAMKDIANFVALNHRK